MTKWEYVTVPLLVHATKQILDNWGQDGWELAHAGESVAAGARWGGVRRGGSRSGRVLHPDA
ncbi:hypothetical protein ABZ372_43210, partial [Streptomyces sp. NPDC005921]